MAINKVIYGGNTLIDLTADTVAAASMLTGVTAHDRSGTVITGTCAYDSDTSDATATAAEILATKTAYVNGTKVTGSMTNNGAVTGVIDEVDEEYTVPAGYHDGSGKVSIDATEQAKIVATNIREGVTILGVEGTMSGTEDVNAQAKTATPAVTAQTVLPDTAQGYNYLSQVTVEAIPYTETANTWGITATIG